MAKNTEQRKASDQETTSDQEVWPTIRYLDPDVEKDTSDLAVVITLVGLVCIVGIVLVLLLLRGL